MVNCRTIQANRTSTIISFLPSNELKVIGLHELLIEKQKKRTDTKLKTIEIFSCNNVDVHTPRNGIKTSKVVFVSDEVNRPDATKNDLPEKCVVETTELVHVTKNGFPESCVTEVSDLDIVSKEVHIPEDVLKSLPEYENWIRKLTNVRKRVAAKNQTLQDKKPLELLNDIIEGVKYSFFNLSAGQYKCIARIEGQCFSGTGSSEQAARLQSVKVILSSVFSISYDKLTVTGIEELSVNTNDNGGIIEWLILDKYKSVMGNHPYYLGYKVIAGIVKSVDNDRNSLKVISIGTGSKFPYEMNLNSKGNAVHDTHAEVVARRGFIRYIYNQISQHNAANCIFERSDANEKFRLKSGIKFHLIHSHTNGKKVNGIIPEGQLRTKGQCALTVTKDALSSESVSNVNMSCSAKLLRWNVLGIQGALLTELIEPIYLTSMIFGEKFDPKHMKRALYGRIESNVIELPKGFNIVQPELMKVSVTKAKSAAFSPNHSVNWNVQGYDVEILESTSGCTMGKDKTERYSRISKPAYFNEFVKIAKKLKHPSEATTYFDAKQKACDYQMTKSTLFQIFENNGLGTWVQKQQRNFDNFTI